MTTISNALSTAASWLRWPIDVSSETFSAIDWRRDAVPCLAAVAGVTTAIYLQASQRHSTHETILGGIIGAMGTIAAGAIFDALENQYYVWKYGMPSGDWKALQKLNREKSPNDPVALILQAKGDKNGALPTFYEHIEQIAKTHYVVFKILDNGKKLGPKINEANEELKPRPIQCLIINAHGHPAHIQFGTTMSHFYSRPRESDFQMLSERAEIILFSCSTGQSFAQKIADRSHRVVIAPIDDIASVETIFAMCPAHRRLEMNAYNHREQYVRVFEYNKRPEAPCLPDRAGFQQLFDSLLQLAKDGESAAQLAVGCLYIREHGFFPPAPAKAFEWLSKVESDKNEYGAAQYELGCLYEKEDVPDWSNAIKRFETAANLKYPEAQIKLAQLYETGRGGCRNLDSAIEWYTKVQTNTKSEPALQDEASMSLTRLNQEKTINTHTIVSTDAKDSSDEKEYADVPHELSFTP